MIPFPLGSILISLAAVSSYVDYRSIKLLTTVGVMRVTLVALIALLLVGPYTGGLREAIGFAGDLYVLFGLSIAVVFLWWLAVSQWAVRRACLAPARDDDTCRCCHHYGLCLQQRRGVWPDRHDVVLGVDDPRRHHAAGTLDRNEVGDGCLDGPGGTGQAHALGCPQFSGSTAV